MQLRNLGSSELPVSLVGLGCNNFGGRLDAGQSAAVVHRALDLGITLFDTAGNYGEGRSETLLGQALGPRRKDIVLATKFGKRGGAGSRDVVMRTVERSLTALRTDWIDLYQLHWPDPQTPIEETLRALDDLIRQGKVRYIGCSNMAAWQVVEAIWVARSRKFNAFVSCQDEYSLLARRIERDLIPATAAYGLGLLAYSPLAGGLLTGKYRAGETPPERSRMASPGIYADKFLTTANLHRVSELSALAQRHGLSLLDVALRWLATRQAVTSIVMAAMTPEQLSANVSALDEALPALLLDELDQSEAEHRQK